MKGLYIHIPFCRNKCSYCGFYSETDSYGYQQEYFRALITDLKSRDKKRYDSIYLGGGTPSTADRKMLAAFTDIVSVLQTGDSKETTIEANPESIDEDFCRMLHDYKFSRISIGCQSTNDDVLKMLTRIHSAEDIRKAYDMVRRLCPNIAVNLDMMYDIPGTDFETSYKTMKDIIAMNPEHISAYTYSHDTNFLQETDDDTTDFMIVREGLEDAGYIKYEISNFAKKGHESIHNINYWRLGDYDGIGASAWSLINEKDKRILKGKTDNIKEYIADPTAFKETEITESPKMEYEKIVFGLRIIGGVDVENICTNLDAELKEKLYNLLIQLAEQELITWDGSKAALTKKGELLLDSVQSLLWEQLP